jgi:integrase
MPRASQNILATDLQIKAVRVDARTDFRIKGAPSLQLRVTPSGSKTWSAVYKSPGTGKWAKKAIGAYPAIGLAPAKDRASDVLADVRKGLDPIHDGGSEVLWSFKDLADAYLIDHERRNRRDGRRTRSTAEAERQLVCDIRPTLDPMLAHAVRKEHVRRIFEAIKQRGSAVSADRALGLIRAIYNWAIDKGYVETNPTIGLKKLNASKEKTRVLTVDELATVWTLFDRIPSITAPLVLAMRIQILTAARIDEVMGAAISEVNLQDQTWTIPADRTKSNRQHVVPLSLLAMATFREAIDLARSQAVRRARRSRTPYADPKFVFPSAKTGGPIEGHAASRALVRERSAFSAVGIYPFNTHDFRRSTATGLGDLNVAEGVVERLLNHAPRSVTRRHYNHARLLGPMKDALEMWSNCLVSALQARDLQRQQAA